MGLSAQLSVYFPVKQHAQRLIHSGVEQVKCGGGFGVGEAVRCHFLCLNDT